MTNILNIFSDDISEDEEFPETDINKQHTKDEHSSREASPLKESILNKFSKFSSKSPNPSINNGDPQQQPNEIPSNRCNIPRRLNFLAKQFHGKFIKLAINFLPEDWLK